MTQSVYVIGAAGVGKSTFMGELLQRLPVAMSPELEDLHAKPNAAGNQVTLRGHYLYQAADLWGVYLGVWREQFPGSDGLDRASSPTGEEWLHGEGQYLPDAIIAEGATLATRRFMKALNETTDLLVLALRCDPVVHDLRLAERGAGQVSSFVLSTVTKTENLVNDLRKEGARVEWIDADTPAHWRAGLQLAESHLSQ